MASYNITGKRFIRKYTAETLTPTYAAGADAVKIAETLCEVPWTPTARDIIATFPAHSGNEKTDGDNVTNRDWFDAALFCGEHANGMHRAFANGACYRFALPDDAIGKMLTEFKAQIFSDPYNANGARIALYTASSADIPTACAICRKGSSDDESASAQSNNGTESTPATEWYSTNTHVEGVAPRRSDGTSWFTNSGSAFIRATGGITLQKYLFVFVLMERYDVARNGYLEGSSYSEPKFSITTSAAIPGWTDGGTYDCGREPDNAFSIVKDGVLPYIVGASPVGEVHVAVRADANLIIEADGSQTPIRTATGRKAASAVSRLFHALFTGGGDIPVSGDPYAEIGAVFNVTRMNERHLTPTSDRPDDTDVLRVDSAALIVPFTYPTDFTPARLSLSFAELALTPGARFNVFLANEYLLSLTEDQLKSPGLYDGKGGPFDFVGIIESGTSAVFDIKEPSSRFGTVIITGYFPPEQYNLTTGGTQGTGLTAFLPDISITD